MTSILKTDEIQSQNGGAVVKMQTLKHPSASGNNITLDSSNNVSLGGTLSAGTIGGDVVFPSGSLVQVVNASYSFTGDSNGVNGTERNQAFGTVQSMTLKYANTKIWCTAMIPEIYANGKRFGLGFCYTTNSGLTAGQGNNDPEGTHSATVVQDYKQRNNPEVNSATINFIATISNTIDTVYYFAPVISQVSGDSIDVYVNWAGGQGTMTQSFGEIAP